MTITIVPVIATRDRRRFALCTKEIYRTSDQWCPPLWGDERDAWTHKKVPALAHNDHQLFLAQSADQRVLGRAMVMVDLQWNRQFDEHTALFGAFDAVEDGEVVAKLLASCKDWARKRGCSKLLGPINPIAEYWGFLEKGFDTTPMFLTPWNYPAIPGLVEAAGLSRAKTLVALEANMAKGYALPQRFSKFGNSFLKRHEEFSVRSIDRRKFSRDAEHIWRLSNLSFTGNWGYVPADRAVFMDMARRLKLILDPDAVCFAEHKGHPVGFALGYPDANQLFKAIGGNLLPFGWLKLLSSRKDIGDYRLFGLAVDPKFHGKGLDVLLYTHLYKKLAPRGIRLEANWILEDNYSMLNGLVKLGTKAIKRYGLFSADL